MAARTEPPTAIGENRPSARWIENRPRRGWRPRIDARDLWAYRDVGVILAERDVRVRYKQTLLGVVWVVLQPLLAMVVFTLVLGEGVGVPSEGVPYAAFAMAGLAIWFPLSSAITGAASSLVSDPELVTKVYFPRLLAPLGAVLATFLDLAIAVGIAVVVAVVAGVTPPATALLLLTIPYRDVAHALGFGLQLLFFISPVVYPVTLLGDPWQTLVAVNPVAGLIDLTRWMLLDTPIDAARCGLSAAVTAALIASGLVFFRRVERQFADRI